MSELSRNELFAALGTLSGDPALTNTGKMLGSFENSRQRGTTGKVHMGNGFLLDQETGEVEQDPNYAGYLHEREEGRDARMNAQQEAILRRMGYGADLRRQNPRYSTQETDGGVAVVQTNPNAEGGIGLEETVPLNQPVSAGDRQKAAEAERLAYEATDLYGELEREEGVISAPKDMTTSALSQVPIVGKGLARAAEGKLYSPAQLSIKTRGARYEQNLSNLAAGLALTGYEIDQRDRWSPFAMGIGQEEGKRRLTNIQRDFGTRRDTILNAPSVTPRNRREAKPDYRSETEIPRTMQPPRNAEAVEARRTLKGRSYKKVGGRWYAESDGTEGY